MNMSDAEQSTTRDIFQRILGMLPNTSELTPILVTIPDANAPGQVLKPELSDEQKHWLIVGICLQSVLSHALRKYVSLRLTTIYSNLKSSENIDQQTFNKYLPEYNKNKLNYEAINNNVKLKRKDRYDFNVMNDVDFSKLLLETRMAQYTAFDVTCDTSAMLIITEKIDNHNTILNNLAQQVRTNVRNPWAHCNFAEWDVIKYMGAFQLMQLFIRNLCLPKTEEDFALTELHKWQINGILLLQSPTLGLELLQVIRNETKSLAQCINSFCGVLGMTIETTQLAISEIDEKIDSVFSTLGQVNASNTLIISDTQTLSANVVALEERTDNLEIVTQEMQTNIAELQVDVGKTSFKVSKLETDLEKTKMYVSENARSIAEIKMYLSDKRPEKVLFYPPDKMLFVGREDELKTLQNDLLSNIELHCMRFVCGLGGIGKTTLVVEYAWQMLEHYPGGVFWMSAESNDSLEESICKLAFDIDTNGQNTRETIFKTLSWLRSLQKPWLLVVDNLDCDEITGNIKDVVLGAWRRNSKGHIIGTTRREALEASETFFVKQEHCLTLDILTQHESLVFLAQRTGIAVNESDHDILCLIEHLGGLPLALEQAAAHIKVLHCSFKEYLDSFLQKRLKLLRKSKSSGTMSKERLAVTTTWDINFECIQKQSAEEGIGTAAVTVMQVTAFLASDDIPTAIINCGSPNTDDKDLLNALQNELGAKQVIEVLTRFSLFNRSSINSIAVHRLVQEVIRNNITDMIHLKCVLQCATRMINKALETTHSPIDVLKSVDLKRGSLYLWNTLVLNANALCTHLLDISRERECFKEIIFNIETAKLLQATAIYQSIAQRQDQALAAQSQMLEIITAINISVDTFRDLTCIKIPLLDKVRSHLRKSITAVLSDNKSAEQPTLCPRDTETLRLLGNKAFQEKRFSDAIQYYTEGIRADVDHIDPRLLSNRSMAYFKTHQYENVLVDANSCIKLDSTMWKPYCRKSLAIAELIRSAKVPSCYKSVGVASASVAAYLNKPCHEHMKLEYPMLHYILITTSRDIEKYLIASESREYITLLLISGKYVISTCSIIKKSVQIIGIEKDVEIFSKSQIELGSRAESNDVAIHDIDEPINIYIENVKFGSDCGDIIAYKAVSVLFFKCQFSNGRKSCERFPYCNGESGCANVNPEICKLERAKFQQTLPHYCSGVSGRPGVTAWNGGYVFIDNCILDRCGGGGTLSDGTDSVLEIRNSVVKNMRQAGIESRNGGKTIAENNQIIGNQFHGILVGPCGRAVIRKNCIQGNGQEGIWCGGMYEYNNFHKRNTSKASCCQISENIIYQNALSGVSFEDGTYELTGNKIFENQLWGVMAKLRSSLLAVNNDIFCNKCGGIRIGMNYSATVVFDGNTIRDHTGPGLYVLPNDPYLPGMREFMLSDWCDDDTLIRFNLIKGEVNGWFSNPPLLTSRNIIKMNDIGFLHPRQLLSAVPICCNCRTISETLKRCSKCYKATYCGQECQRQHWNRHKNICVLIAADYIIEIKMKDTKMSDFLLSSEEPFRKTIGKGKPVDRKSTERFIIKAQLGAEYSPYDPNSQLLLYNQYGDFSRYVKNTKLYHLVHECGVLATNQFTAKKIFCWAVFKSRGDVLCILADNLPPLQTW